MWCASTLNTGRGARAILPMSMGTSAFHALLRFALVSSFVACGARGVRGSSDSASPSAAHSTDGDRSGCSPAPASATFTCNEARVAIETRAGVTLAFDLVTPAKAPSRVVILLTGGDGNVSLTERGMSESASKNFVVRTRQAYATAGLVAGVPDSPSDHEGGLEGDFRSSPEHAEDMRALIAWLDVRYHLPVWMIATSRGTISAANAGARLGTSGPRGLVLTSPLTVSEKGKDSLEHVDLAKVTIPVEVISHAEDGCGGSPYSSASAMAKARGWRLVTEQGGSESCNDPACKCGPSSHHGFDGLDGEVVPKILAFVAGS
jgi:hypothetical protein